MHIGFIAAGPAGLSPEMEKWSQVLDRMGHQIYRHAGKLPQFAGDTALRSLPEFSRMVEQDVLTLREALNAAAEDGYVSLQDFIGAHHLALLIVDINLSFPFNLPQLVALAGLIGDLNLKAIFHYHGLSDEITGQPQREAAFRLETLFPARLTSVRHVAGNSAVQQWLKERHGLDSEAISPAYDFGAPPFGPDSCPAALRAGLGLGPHDYLILYPAPVRAAPELAPALELAHRLTRPHVAHLFLGRRIDQAAEPYCSLKQQAAAGQVALHGIEEVAGAKQDDLNGRQPYTLADILPHADLVICPGPGRGAGHALLEAVYFKRLVAVNADRVYRADIRPLGFEFIELAGGVDGAVVRHTRELLANPGQAAAIAEKNYAIGWERCSLEVLEIKLKELLETLV